MGLNDIIYHEGNISKMPDLDVFSLLEFCKRTTRLYGIKKNGNCTRKNRVQKLAYCTLRDLAAKLDVHVQHCMFSYLSSLLISVLFWLVGCFGFNGPFWQYFSLYRAVSQREGERKEKR